MQEYQFRLNGVILPEGISFFGQTLSPRLIESMKLVTGALPAEFGLRTAGIIDITTKSGALDTGGDISFYGGSHSTVNPSAEYGGTSGNVTYFVSGDYLTRLAGNRIAGRQFTLRSMTGRSSITPSDMLKTCSIRTTGFHSLLELHTETSRFRNRGGQQSLWIDGSGPDHVPERTHQ